MPDTDPLAVERFRTILTDTIRDTGYDAYGMADEADPDTVAIRLVHQFPEAHFEHRVNEHGAAVRRVVVAGEWETDPNPPEREARPMVDHDMILFDTPRGGTFHKNDRETPPDGAVYKVRG
jgi:hypothetical protein